MGKGGYGKGKGKAKSKLQLQMEWEEYQIQMGMGGGAANGWAGPAAPAAFPGGFAAGWGIEGLNQALVSCLMPIKDEEAEWDMAEMVRKCQQKVTKASQKFEKDERATQKSTASGVKVILEEFVDAVMGSLSGAMYERPWFNKVDWTMILHVAVAYTFQGAKCFNRTLGPNLQRITEEALTKWQEEERIGKALWEAVAAAGVLETHQKRARQHLTGAFDEAHLHAPYGGTQADSPALALLQDFVKGWMHEFVKKAWDVIEHGHAGAGSKDESVLFLTVLFQNLCDPDVACVPHEIIMALEGLPASPWEFIAHTAEEALTKPMPPRKKFKVG